MGYSMSHSGIYKAIVSTLEQTPLERGELIDKCIGKAHLSENELTDRSVGSTQNNLRSRIGAVLNEMHAHSLVGLDEFGRYYLASARPVIVRFERCEKEIVKALSESPMSKVALRDRLKTIFGTDKTATTRDDDTVSTYMGQILKRLLVQDAVRYENNLYSLSPKLSANADNINELLTLKSDYLRKLHSKGGEFFENYFMQLLQKYMKKHGRKVLECYVTGGTTDGGIDGVIKTEDSLGFRETVMVQTKNRLDFSSETDVRGFYGAVCAKRGTRGIFATTSDFHTSAKNFFDGLDDCVGVNGERIFKMAIECLHGIKKNDGKLEIDPKML